MRRGHHGDVAVSRQEPLADPSAYIGTIKNWQMRFVKMRCAFQCHGAAHMNIRRFNFIFAKTKMFQHVKFKVIQLCICDAQFILAEISPKGELVKGKFDVKRTAKRRFDFVNLGIAKAFVFECIYRHGLAGLQTARTNRIANDIVDLALRIAKPL